MKKKRYIWCEYCDDGWRDTVYVDSSQRNLPKSPCRTYYQNFRKVFPQAPQFKDGLKFKIDVTNAKVMK